jgi:hypothetical protein
MYGGLVACWYFLIYGVTSLAFNHPWLLPVKEGAKREWQRDMAAPVEPDNLKLAEAVRDHLGLIGWPLPWNMWRDREGELHYEMARPGRKYMIHVDASAARVVVEEQHTGLGSVLKALHGPTEGIPNSRWMNLWGIYTEVTTWFLLFAVASGIFLWARRARDRQAAWVVLVGSLVFSVGFMVYVYFIG